MGQPEIQLARPRVWRLFDQSLAVQFVTAGGIVVLAFGVSLTLLLSQVRKQANASLELNASHSTISGLTLLGREMYRQQMAVFGYVQTRDSNYLAFIDGGHKAWRQRFSEIRDLARDEKQQENLDRLGQRYDAWVLLTDWVVSGSRSLDPDTVKEEAKLSKETFQLIDEMVIEQNQLISIRNSQEKQTIHRSFLAIVVINLALLALFAYVLGRLYVSIARPISALSEAMTEFQKGDWQARVRISSRSQIGFLQLSFNEMARTIQAMVSDLRKLDEMKTEFVSTVSHELRTPLTSIGGYTKLLSAGDAGEVNETQREFLQIIETNVHRLTDLINDILDVERMESGKFELQREKTDLVSILKECVDTFKPVAASKGLALNFVAEESELSVLGDRARLAQVFMNLISNAVKYTEKGFVEISAKEQNFAIVVRVRDSGIGIAPEDQEKLFQKFYRTGAAQMSNAGGTGLGLVIARGLIETHGGKISLESATGQGTIFSVTFPSANALEEERISVEQEPIALHREGPVWTFGSGLSEAPGLFESKREVVKVHNLDQWPASESPRPALAVVDADQFSLEAVKPRLPDGVPLLVVSSTIDAAYAFRAGASAFVQKPLLPQDFHRAAQDLLRAKGGRVLIGDPNPDVRLLTKRSLEQSGFLVDDVDHGNLVLRRLGQERYDLVLIDLNFPDVSGAELLKAIRKNPASARVPVIVMLDDEKKKPLPPEKLLSLGADHFVGKYEGIGGIAEAVSDFLAERKTK